MNIIKDTNNTNTNVESTYCRWPCHVHTSHSCGMGYVDGDLYHIVPVKKMSTFACYYNCSANIPYAKNNEFWELITSKYDPPMMCAIDKCSDIQYEKFVFKLFKEIFVTLDKFGIFYATNNTAYDLAHSHILTDGHGNFSLCNKHLLEEYTEKTSKKGRQSTQPKIHYTNDSFIRKFISTLHPKSSLEKNTFPLATKSWVDKCLKSCRMSERVRVEINRQAKLHRDKDRKKTINNQFSILNGLDESRYVNVAPNEQPFKSTDYLNKTTTIETPIYSEQWFRNNTDYTLQSLEAASSNLSNRNNFIRNNNSSFEEQQKSLFENLNNIDNNSKHSLTMNNATNVIDFDFEKHFTSTQDDEADIIDNTIAKNAANLSENFSNPQSMEIENTAYSDNENDDVESSVSINSKNNRKNISKNKNRSVKFANSLIEGSQKNNETITDTSKPSKAIISKLNTDKPMSVIFSKPSPQINNENERIEKNKNLDLFNMLDSVTNVDNMSEVGDYNETDTTKGLLNLRLPEVVHKQRPSLFSNFKIPRSIDQNVHETNDEYANENDEQINDKDDYDINYIDIDDNDNNADSVNNDNTNNSSNEEDYYMANENVDLNFEDVRKLQDIKKRAKDRDLALRQNEFRKRNRTRNINNRKTKKLDNRQLLKDLKTKNRLQIDTDLYTNTATSIDNQTTPKLQRMSDSALDEFINKIYPNNSTSIIKSSNKRGDENLQYDSD